MIHSVDHEHTYEIVKRMGPEIKGALIGALVAIIVPMFASHYRNYQIKKAIYLFLKTIVSGHLQIYADSCDHAIIRIKDVYNEENSKPLSDLVSLNSEILKYHSLDQLLSVFDASTCIKLNELAYSIDFFRRNMPLDFIVKYNALSTEHIESEKQKGKIEEGDEIEHLHTCEVMKSHRRFLNGQLSNVKSAALQYKVITDQLIKEIEAKDHMLNYD